jgi:hypothetical protein
MRSMLYVNGNWKLQIEWNRVLDMCPRDGPKCVALVNFLEKPYLASDHVVT